jgi:cell division septum initiation protein DivIVA
MSSITTSVKELEEINKEMISLRRKIKELKDRKDSIEKDILDYLEKKEEYGLKYKNIAIIAEEKEKRLRKKKQDKLNDGVNYLKENGVSNAEHILQNLLDKMKGNISETKILKLKEIKK